MSGRGFMRTGKGAARRGVTLLEMLIFVAVFALIAVSTLRVVGDARVIRSNARDRAVMVLIAQTELERLRAAPPAQRMEGTELKHSPEWPEGTQVRVETTRHDSGMWMLDVKVNRESIEGKPSVRLTTLVSGGLE